MQKQIHFVYLLTFPNGKIYVGMSRTDKRGLFTLRYNNHAREAVNGNPLPIYNAWRKHGAPKQTILSMHDSRMDASIAETEAIANLNARNQEFGYNIQPGGEGNKSASCPEVYAIMLEKVWNNPDRNAKLSASLKGRRPHESTLTASIEARKKSSEWKEKISALQSAPEYKKLASERTKIQMANGGSAHLSKIFKGRKDPRTESGKRAHKEKIKAFMNTAEGKEVARKGYEAFASNPKNLEAAQAGLQKWRESKRNKEHCKKIAMLASKKCSIKVMDVASGIVYNSQRDAAQALRISDAAISKRVKAGKFVRI